MPRHFTYKHNVPGKTVVILLLFMFFVSAAIYGTDESTNKIASLETNHETPAKDSAISTAAFMEVYKVLMHPRCMNCHPAGNIPLQNDDSHVHTMLPRRGLDEHGVYALKCTNCHQPSNTPGLRTPPGNPKWALPPANMKMVFQGKTAHELAKQILDYNQNGHKSKKQLLEHARDTLVKWAWNPGEGRTLPPLKYKDFVKAWDTWINTGGYAPAK
jgi:hypothetical protein